MIVFILPNYADWSGKFQALLLIGFCCIMGFVAYRVLLHYGVCCLLGLSLIIVFVAWRALFSVKRNFQGNLNLLIIFTKPTSSLLCDVDFLNQKEGTKAEPNHKQLHCPKGNNRLSAI